MNQNKNQNQKKQQDRFDYKRVMPYQPNLSMPGYLFYTERPAPIPTGPPMQSIEQLNRLMQMRYLERMWTCDGKYGINERPECIEYVDPKVTKWLNEINCILDVQREQVSKFLQIQNDIVNNRLNKKR